VRWCAFRWRVRLARDGLQQRRRRMRQKAAPVLRKEAECGGVCLLHRLDIGQILQRDLQAESPNVTGLACIALPGHCTSVVTSVREWIGGKGEET
jgi:hypothetical protein